MYHMLYLCNLILLLFFSTGDSQVRVWGFYFSQQ